MTDRHVQARQVDIALAAMREAVVEITAASRAIRIAAEQSKLERGHGD